MRHLKQQTEPGPCINCDGDGWVPIDTYYGDEEDWEHDEKCGVCDGRGKLTAQDIENLGWTVPMF